MEPARGDARRKREKEESKIEHDVSVFMELGSLVGRAAQGRKYRWRVQHAGLWRQGRRERRYIFPATALRDARMPGYLQAGRSSDERSAASADRRAKALDHAAAADA